VVDKSTPTLRFLGATQTVTGSRFLIEWRDHRILIDCGLFQGYKQLRLRNRHPFPVRASDVDAVVLSHAHLDHTGYIPALVRDGFAGRVYATAGTVELCSLLLPDSGHLQEEEAQFVARRGSSKHARPRPLYTEEDARRSLSSFHVTRFDHHVDLGNGLGFTLRTAGHILGAAQVRVSVADRTVHFTGDLGRPDDPLMNPPHALEETDVLISESTYGDRAHPSVDPEQELADVIRRVAKRGGVVLIPSFAVGRAETLLLHISRLRARNQIPAIPVFLNSPMAVDASIMYQGHQSEHRVSPKEFADMYSLATLVHSMDDSKLLNLRGGPMIIISASGMLTGGRILHHIDAYGPDKRNAIVLSGFQAGGTRGAALARGDDSIRIFGRDVPIRAEVVALESLSAHADADDILAWMRTAPRAPSMTYLVHGEPDASDALRARIKRELGWRARVPEHLETVDLANPR